MANDVVNQVLESPRLPSLPAIAIEVIELVQRDDVHINDIADTISHDPALAGKILKTVNSSFYAQSSAISSISKALVVLGLNSVKTLALGFSLVGKLSDEGGDGFDRVNFWKRSLYTAVAARSIADMINYEFQEECFLAGLFQDIGVIAMHQALDAKYHDLVKEVGPEHHLLSEKEIDVYGVDHATVGTELLEMWKLPPVLVKPVAYHQAPESAPVEFQHICKCVTLGGCAAAAFTGDDADNAVDQFYLKAQEWFDLDPDHAKTVLHSLNKNTNEMRRLFDLPVGELEDPQVILERAHETLLQISLKQQQQQNELQEANKQLAQQASTDSLTELANRRVFDEFMVEQFKLAGAEKPLSVLFLDVDHFKKFNDTYGHQVGDRVLTSLGQVLKYTILEPALCARYGGEEFAVVLPSTSRPDAVAKAEQLRQNIEKIEIESDDPGAPGLHVTASIGVATYEGVIFVRPGQLVKAADQAVYASKSAGRNTVRAFVPKAAA